MKPRATLKDYFKKGAIPKESDFADLIDSMLIQDEDSILKLPNDPLSIKATGAEEALLNFYRVQQGNNALTWQLKQKEADKLGLSIHDGAASRLFIDSANGNVGIGTTTPNDKLDVAGAVRLLTDSNPIRITSAWSSFPDALTNQAEISNDIGNYKTLMIVGNRSAGIGRRVSVWDRLEVNGNLAVTGNVGIGTPTTQGQLQIVGPPSFDSSTILHLTNGATDHGRTNLVLTGRFNAGNDAWNFGSSARNSIVFAKNAKAANVDVGGLGIEQFSIQLEGNTNSLGFLTAQLATKPALVIQQDGWVGIGGFAVPGVPENTQIMIMRGKYNPAGNVQTGRGFTTSRVGLGIFDIFFTPPFSDLPAVVVTQEYPGDFNNGGDTRDNAVLVAVRNDRCRIKCGGSDGIPADRLFHFIAIGPR